MRNINGVIRHKISLLCVLILSLGICYRVNSYTFAIVENSVGVKISSSENALIAMPEEIDLRVKKDITIIKTLTDKESNEITNTEVMENGEIEVLTDEDLNTQVSTETLVNVGVIGHNFYITNNMNDTIYVNIDLERGFNRLRNQGTLTFSYKGLDIPIFPGQTKEIPFNVDENIESGVIGVVISATWDGGSADIENHINIDVETIVTEKEIDLRKPKEPELTNDDELETTVESNDESIEEIENTEQIEEIKTTVEVDSYIIEDFTKNE